MIKVLQFGDLHLGMENFGNIDPQRGLNSRFLDFLKTLDQIIEIALRNQVDMVIFSGDAYKTANPTPTQERELAKRLNRLIKNQIETLLLVGNHDLPLSPIKANALDVFSALEVEGLYVIRKPTIFQSKKNPLQILAIPWVNKNFLLSNTLKDPNLLNETALSLLFNIFNDLLKQARKNQKPTIALIHGSIEGALYPNLQSTLYSEELLLPKNWFLSDPILYTIAGHIHKPQLITSSEILIKEKLLPFFEKPHLLKEKAIFYSGSPDFIDFGEEGELKCVAILSIDEKTQNLHFKLEKLSVRELKTIEIKLERETNPTQEAIEKIKKEKIADTILRLKITASEHQKKLFRESALLEVVKDCYFYAGINWQIEKTESKKIYNLESKTDEELLRIYLKRKKIGEEKIEKLIKAYRLYCQKDVP